ncbi:MAG TPA: hypothetical protein VFT82_04645 [Candidatus Paceibacterota bacterium]|nr:hypothetical protein [Candidatus Paceibacterota bacterium]
MNVIRNNYVLETIVAWVEGISLVGALGFLFFSWQVSAVCLAAFVIALPLRNFIRFGAFYPAKAPSRIDTLKEK